MTIKAVVENRKLHSLTEVPLPEGTLVDIEVVTPAPADNKAARVAAQRSAMAKLIKALDAVPPGQNGAGFSSKDHDAILYDWKDRR
jgi:hypothetical protein